MDEDDLPPEAARAPMMRSFALTATGDFMLLVGLFFLLLGIANFITDFLGIKGAGEATVGCSLIAIAIAILVRSQSAMRRMQAERPPVPQPPDAPAGGESSYR